MRKCSLDSLRLVGLAAGRFLPRAGTAPLPARSLTMVAPSFIVTGGNEFEIGKSPPRQSLWGRGVAGADGVAAVGGPGTIPPAASNIES